MCKPSVSGGFHTQQKGTQFSAAPVAILTFLLHECIDSINMIEQLMHEKINATTHWPFA
jgi:hypothetical protein